MIYSQSKQILEAIQGSKRILINAHSRPDLDSISSAISLYLALGLIGKNATLICPDDILPEVSFLKGYRNFRKIDYSRFNFSEYDLFVILDSASPEVVIGNKFHKLPDIKKIIIDHHKTNTKFGRINLVDAKRSATAELLYLLFKDWNVRIDKSLATSLLTGIMGDTGAFEYHNTTPQTLQIAAELMLMGADKDDILLKIFRTKNLNLLKFWGKALDGLEVDKSGKFSWVAIDYKTYRALGKPALARNSASSMFARMVKGTEFGIVMVEEEPSQLHMSFRSRKDFDVSKIAAEFGGGGHPGASGATINDTKFDIAVKKVLSTARKFVK